MHLVRAVLVALLLVTPVAAQDVRPVPDAVSYLTASVNPTIAAIEAARSSDPWCRLTQLGISELVGNTLVLTLKHAIRSPRPCFGCPSDGMPSGHAMNATIGISFQWTRGAAAAATTAALRSEANRHTKTQLVAGIGVGLLAEYLGHLVKCEGK